jgi:hypothetical protein
MNTPEERMWTRVADASRPNAAEMAAAEAELRALDDAEPLPVNLVDSVLERATAPQAAPVAVVAGPAPRSWRRVLLMAALLLVSVSGIAWFVAERTWKEEHSAPFVLDYRGAVGLATEPGRDEQIRYTGVAILEDYCSEASRALRELSTNSTSPLAVPAMRVRKELADLLMSGDVSRPSRLSGDFLEVIAAVRNNRLSTEARLAALQQVQRYATAGLTAILLSKPFFTGDHEKNWHLVVQRLRSDYGE